MKHLIVSVLAVAKEQSVMPFRLTIFWLGVVCIGIAAYIGIIQHSENAILPATIGAVLLIVTLVFR